MGSLMTRAKIERPGAPNRSFNCVSPGSLNVPRHCLNNSHSQLDHEDGTWHLS